MSFIVLSNSSRVILPMRTKIVSPSLQPTLKGVLISQARYTGLSHHSFISIDEAGIPRPFRGDKWCHEWRTDGENLLALWLGFPNVFFSTSFDPSERVAVEALGHFGSESHGIRTLSRIEITVKPTQEITRTEDSIAWMPEDKPRIYPEI